MSDQNSENSGPNDRVEPSFSSIDGDQSETAPAENAPTDPQATAQADVTGDAEPAISAVEPDPEADPVAQIAALQASLAEAKERHLRAVAEMENVGTDCRVVKRRC